jgi:hypothetical protein
VAITIGAKAVVILNGRPTRPVQTRSIRQGDPCAPLFIIFALEGLNYLLKEALADGSLRGIGFEEVDIHLAQQLYSDKTSIMIEATVENARQC